MATLDIDSSEGLHVATAAGRPRTFLGRWMQSRRDVAAARAEQEYSKTLLEASTEDFKDLDQLEFLQTSARDKEGRPLVVVMARNYPAKVLNLERVYKYLITRLEPLAEEPYSVVWFHTGSTYWQNCPSLAWLWRTYERLPDKYRAHLHRLYMVHCDLPLWLGLSALGPLLSESLWRKVEWVARVEFLWDHVPRNQVFVPGFVAEHDAVLEDQPLMDYGVVAAKELNSVPGLPGPI